MDNGTCTVNSYSANTVSLCACAPVSLCGCALNCLVLCIDNENGPQKAYSCFLISPHFGLVVTFGDLQAMHGERMVPV